MPNKSERQLASLGEYAVDLCTLEPYEATALILTLMTYPPSGAPDTGLDQRYGEICAFVLRRRAEMSPAWAEQHHLVRPMHTLIPVDRVNAAGRTMLVELEHRLTAGRMAIAFIDQAVLGDASRLPKGVKRLSQNQMAAYVAGAEDSNVETRAFRPSAPVLHLCAALAWTRLLLNEPPHGNQRSIVDFLIDDINVLRAFVLTAQDFEAPVAASEKLRISPDRLVRVRWID